MNPNLVNHEGYNAISKILNFRSGSCLSYENIKLVSTHMYKKVGMLLEFGVKPDVEVSSLGAILSFYKVYSIYDITDALKNNFEQILKITKKLIFNGANVNGHYGVDSLLTWLINRYDLNPTGIHQLMHLLLIHGADPNQCNIGHLLGLLDNSRHTDYGYGHRHSCCPPSILSAETAKLYDKTLSMLLTYGFVVQGESAPYFWKIVPTHCLISFTTIDQIKMQRAYHQNTMKILRKNTHKWIHHPDRLRVRIHNAQRCLDANCYAKWLEQDAGWLEYLGIYDLKSFQEKMREYNRDYSLND